jgi:hypothetical protein
MTVMLTCGVLAGYTLQPVPKWLSNLFNTSHVFKFLILFFAGVTAVYPLDGNELFLVFVCSISILFVFELLRYFDTKDDELKNNEN